MQGSGALIDARSHRGLLRPGDGSGEVHEVEIEVARHRMQIRAEGRTVGTIDPDNLTWRLIDGDWTFTIAGETWRFAPRDFTRFTSDLSRATDQVVIDLTEDPDVTVISGIGPVTARALATLDIHTVRDLAEIDGATRDLIREAVGSRFDRGHWVEQAREAVGLAPLPSTATDPTPEVEPPQVGVTPRAEPVSEVEKVTTVEVQATEEPRVDVTDATDDPASPVDRRTRPVRRLLPRRSGALVSHDHKYGEPTSIGGIIRAVCSVCRHVTFSSEDLYQVG